MKFCPCLSSGAGRPSCGRRPRRPLHRFASCQSASSSSIGVPFTCLPCAVSLRSTCPNRWRNFAFVRRSACSGSTFTKRARFTIVNNRSPTSSSMSSCDPRSQASANSSRSSSSLARTSSALLQSKPARAARDVICCASTSAGKARGTDASSPCGFSAFSLRSSALISSQLFITSLPVEAVSSANTCGCRRTSFSLIASSESPISKNFSSAAISPKKTACSMKPPSSARNSSQSRRSTASRTSYVSSSVYGLIVSNDCSRSHGQPPGARSRAMISTNCWNFAPALFKPFSCIFERRGANAAPSPNVAPCKLYLPSRDREGAVFSETHADHRPTSHVSENKGPRLRHEFRRSHHRLLLRRLPLHRPPRHASPSLHPHSLREYQHRYRHYSRFPRSGPPRRHPAPRRHRLHARPRRSHPRPRRCSPLQLPPERTHSDLRLAHCFRRNRAHLRIRVRQTRSKNERPPTRRESD